MLHTHYDYQCAPVKTFICRKIISTTVLFCFCVMTIRQSIAMDFPHATNVFNDSLPFIEMKNAYPHQEKCASFQESICHVEVTSEQLIAVAGKKKKCTHYTEPFSKFFQFFVGFLCLATYAQKACAANLNLGSLTTEGISITGVGSGSAAGYSVSSAGDVNGDGFADMLIGAPGNSSCIGSVYVILGSKNSTNINLDNPLESRVITITCARIGDQAGYSVSSAGDVNKDGTDDIIIGAPGANIAYVIFGSHTLNDINLANPLGSGGITITGISGSNTGYSVSSAGDVNGDGFADILIGAPSYSSQTGIVYLIYGSYNSTNINCATLGSRGTTITGAGGNAGWSVSSAGDVNGDGFADILIGAPFYSTNTGIAYLIYGGHNKTNINLANPLESRITTITGAGTGYETGYSVSSAGDIDGDGKTDMLIGAYGYSSQAGIVYIIYGNSTLANINLANPLGSRVTTITGAGSSYYTGYSVSSAGDVNGDGKADMLIGAPFASGRGSVYIIYGGHNLTNIDCASLGGSGSIIMGAGTGYQTGYSISSAGDVNGDGYVDMLIGAPYGGSSNAGKAYLIYGAASGFITHSPTSQPSGQPSIIPSLQPSEQPSSQPSVQPTDQPSNQPSPQPSVQPTNQPSNQPNSSPSEQPSGQPSAQPIRKPSAQPSGKPTSQPSNQPSSAPSVQPSMEPSNQPSSAPSVQPSGEPTNQPAATPSVQPSMEPSNQPSSAPSVQPSGEPTDQPSSAPSVQPSAPAIRTAINTTLKSTK